MKTILLLLILTYTLIASNITETEKAILSAPTLSERFVLTSKLAEMYEKELGRRYYRETVEKNRELAKKIKKLYLQSLDPIAKTIQLSDHRELLKLSSAKNNYIQGLRPTLYDLLAHRALNYFSTNRFGKCSPRFFSNKTELYAPKDKNSCHALSLQIYNELIALHKKEDNQEALQLIEIEKLEYLYKKSKLKDRDKKFLDGLKVLEKKLPKGEASLRIARFYLSKMEYQKGFKYGQKGINNPNTYIALSSQNLIDEIQKEELGIKIESVNLPHENILAEISYRNIKNLYLKVLKIDDDIIKKIDTLQKKENRFSYIKNLSIFKTLNFELPKSSDYKEHHTEISLESYEIGRYLLIFSSSKDFESKNIYQLIAISNLSYISKNNEEILILNRKSGQPIEGVKATFFIEEFQGEDDENIKSTKQTVDLISDQNGQILFPQTQTKDALLTIRLKKENDILDMRGDNIFYLNEYDEPYSQNEYDENNEVLFYTDRAIYRPLQTIKFKGVVAQKFNNKAPIAVANREVTVYLYGANRKKIAQKILYTDEFGSFFGSFNTPANSKLGVFTLQSSLGGRKYIDIEEYKRPKFTIAFHPIDRSYRLGDTVTVTGIAKSYMGATIADAKMSYTIKRQTFSWSRDYSLGNRVLASGRGVTNNKGEFTLSFKALKDKTTDNDKKTIYTYAIEVKITDLTGETHALKKTISLSDTDFKIKLLGDSSFKKDSEKGIAIESLGLDGKFKALKAEVKIEKYLKEKTFYKKRYWSDEIDKPLYSKEAFKKLFPHYRYKEKTKSKKEQIRSYSIDTTDTKNISLKGLEQGVYLVNLTVEGITISKTVIIQDPTQPEPPMVTPLWHFTDKKTYKKDEQVELTLQSSLPHNSPLFFTLTQDQQVVYEKWISSSSRKESIDLKRVHQGGCFYHITFVHNNRFYTYEGKIVIPWEDKLDVEFITFRNKLKPNEKEQVKLKISTKDKTHPMTQMVATIYDASLDSFVMHNFKTYSLYYKQSYSSLNYSQKTFNYNSLYRYWQKEASEIYREFPILKGSGNSFYSEKEYPEEDDTPYIMELTNQDRLKNLSSFGSEKGGDISGIEFMDEPVAFTTPPIRKDLNETILFAPNLQSDENGEIVIDFKTNGALTRWNLLGFIHTKDFKTAVIKKSFITQKELMVVGNLPRFFRKRDSITLTHKIVNMQNKKVQGESEMRLVNPVTHQPIFTQPFKKHFTIKGNGSTTVSFTFTLPSDANLSAIEHTFLAKTATHTDGEQMVIPVLSHRTLVNQSKILRIEGEQSQHFSFDALQNNHSKTLKNHKLTLEFSSNPAWYAIRSLPYLMEYENECSEQLFARFSANALASQIANQTPKIREIFELWRDKGELKSALNSNKKLKSILLEETPWVLEAKSQEEQLKRLGLLFDIEKMAKEQKKALDKLAKRQLKSGGFSWYGGRYTNWYMTQYIVEGFGHLEKRGIAIKNQKMIRRAVDAMDKQVMLQYKKQTPLSSMVIHYLYARSFFIHFPMSSEVYTSYNYYLNEAQRVWNSQELYEKALIAMALHQNGKDAFTLVESLKKEATVDKELGLYFNYPNGYRWNQLQIETHALMIEVFRDIANDEESVKLLKLWLLQHRQSNHWSSTKSTTSAIYALLDGEDFQESTPIEVQFDNNSSYQAIEEDGTGYFKIEFDEFNSSMANFKVTNPNQNMAFGAIYWQYFEDTQKIKSDKKVPLKITKRLYRILPNKKLELITKDTPIQVGDRVRIRLNITLNSTMEYMMLKDSRASTFEPIDVLSGYQYRRGFSYYKSTKDSATYFFFDRMRKGTYRLEYDVFVTHKGKFMDGLATIESIYAPEFRGHSEGVHVVVE